VRENALILDASLRQSLVAVRCLGRAGVRVHAGATGRSTPAFASRYCQGAACLPEVADDPDAFADAVRDLARRTGRPVIFTSHDGSIDVLSARRRELEECAFLALADNRALTIAADKRKTLALAAKLGIPVPTSLVVADIENLRSAAKEVGLPAVVKPIRSWVDDHRVRRRVVSSVHRRIESLTAAAGALLELQGAVIVQPWLSGDRQAVSFIYSGGEVAAAFAQVAYRTDPPLGGHSVMRESIPLLADIAEPAERLVRAIGLEGYSEIEFRRDARGIARLMEINARLSASVEVAVRSGVDFPLLVYKWARGMKLAPTRRYRVGVRMRWLGGDVRWLARTMSHQQDPDAVPPRAAVSQFGRDFLRPAYYDYLDVRDPRPAIAAFGGFCKACYNQRGSLRYQSFR
jgi:predicted ATP-grasp superfamily ATP-dependent carboligase